MEHFNAFVLARVLHVIGVVLWIGGVAFVTTVLIPALRDLPDPEKRLDLFEKLEGRFSFQAKIVTVVTGASGFYMLHALQDWERYLDPRYWWLHMMTLVWFLFTAVLFFLEPLVLHGWFHRLAETDSTRAFRILHTMHVVLLILSLIAILGTVAGVRGFHIF